MSIYKNFCTETFDRDGVLTGFSVHCPENFNFGYDVVDRLADMTPGKTALVWCNTENEEHIFTFDDIKTYSNKMANVFRAAGIGRGDRVMVILKRHYEYWFAAIALHKLGAVMIPATHMLTVSDLAYRIEASRVKGIICTCQDHVPEKLRQALHRAGSGSVPGDGSGDVPGDGSGGMPGDGSGGMPGDGSGGMPGDGSGSVPGDGSGVMPGGTPDTVPSVFNVSDRPPILWCVQAEAKDFVNMTEAMETASSDFPRVDTKATDPMVLYFTSGTTGNPKGVIHDHTYPLAHIVTARYWQQAEDGGLHFTVAETGWAKASWGKLYGQWLVGSAVMVYDFDNFDPKQLTGVINRYGVTSFCAPPTVYRYLVRKGIPVMPSLKHASTAGEMLAPEVFRKFTEATGIPLCEGYGQTETTLLTANFCGQTPVAGSMGRPSPFYDIKLLDKTGSPVGPGEIGEIVIVPPENGRQIGVFTSYLDNPQQYDHAWRGGVYHTGDAASVDENGLYWFHGRFDDIIKTGGFRVGPYEVENVLMEHPAVVECSVIGVPDPLRGQSIKAIIVPDHRYDPNKELELSIRDFCNHKLAEYKWVRIIEFVDEMPKTISGKIRKNVQRSQGA